MPRICASGRYKQPPAQIWGIMLAFGYSTTITNHFFLIKNQITILYEVGWRQILYESYRAWLDKKNCVVDNLFVQDHLLDQIFITI